MPRACTICTHPHIDKINRAVVAETPRAPLARKYGLTPDSMRRHEQSHISEEMRREIAVDLKRERAQYVADELNDDRLDVGSTYDNLARRVGKLIDKAEADDNDTLALASMEGLRKILHDIASMQGKLAQNLTVQISLMDSKEWIVVRDLLEIVFGDHPAAGKMFLTLAKQKRLSIAHAE